MLTFHEKIKVQPQIKADMCFKEVNNDDQYNYNYANELRPSEAWIKDFHLSIMDYKVIMLRNKTLQYYTMTFNYKSINLTSLYETRKSILKGIYSDRVLEF